ncbi:MAG: BamA/TamA family outer membrane protein [Bacteroidota bacterium]
MTRPLRILILMLVSAGVGAASARTGAASPDPGPAMASSEYRLRLDAFPDSLRGELTGATIDSTRGWSGPDLEGAALRIRDALARRGDPAAVVRLVLARGKGSAPGTAWIEVIGPGSGVTPESAAATSSPRVPVVPWADPVWLSVPPLPVALADSASSAYRRASRGGVSVDAVAAGLSAARDVLIDAGYYGAEITLDSIAVERGAPRPHLHVAAGAPAVFEGIDLPGATATHPSAAATLAGLRPGARVTPAVLVAARERLEASGLFVQVGAARVAPGSMPGRARVVVPVVEERSSRFEGALGVAQGGGVTGLLDLALGNIAGSGRSAGLRWFGPGQGRSEYALRYREPALLKSRVDATLALEAQVADSLFTQTRWSASFGAGPAGGERATLALVRTGSVYSGLARGSSGTWSLATRGSIDRLRPLLNPLHGFRVEVGAEAGRRSERYPGVAAESRGLARADVALEGAFALAPGRVLAASVRGAGTFLSKGGFPAEELRFVGGSEGLRGHADRAFGGSRVATFSLEQRWITDDRGGRVYLFADAARHDLLGALEAGTAAIAAPVAGTASSLARTVLSPGWEFGYGAGLRTRMASGLVGLELGFAPGEPLRRGTIHVRYASTW